jgi:hypothetical protein
MMHDQDLPVTAVIEIRPESQVRSRLASIIERNKHLFMEKDKIAHAYYIGDKEERYLLEHGFSKDRFIEV